MICEFVYNAQCLPHNFVHTKCAYAWLYKVTILKQYLSYMVPFP
jgi:hypothetical protein